MTILDDRPAIDRLTPSTLSILTAARDRFEAALGKMPWDIVDRADADTFADLDLDKFPGLDKAEGEEREDLVEHIDEIKSKITRDLNVAGWNLYEEVVVLLNKLVDDFEMEALITT